MNKEFPFAETSAARMLSEGLTRANEEQGLSLRQLGKQLGYKQAVVLSHMAKGRVPIPIDRAEDLAAHLNLDPAAFLSAVIKQRHPDVSWHLLSGDSWDPATDGLPHELEAILGRPLKDLTNQQRAVMREVAADGNPRRRWLTEHEIPTLLAIRECRPSVSHDGLSASELSALRMSLRQ